MEKALKVLYYVQPVILLAAALTETIHAHVACGLVFMIWLSIEGYKRVVE